MNRTAFPLLLCALALLAGPAAAADDYDLAAFLETPILTAPALSPDGARVAYLERARDLEDDAYLYTLWMADVDGGAPLRLTWDDARVSGLGWRPDGALSFLANRDESTQVWVNPLDGSEPRPVTDLPDGVSAYWWSPDGTRR